MNVSQSKNALKAVLLSVSALNLMAVSPVWSQSSYGNEPYISIYEHCNFEGERRDIAEGEFRRMSELDFKNDAISSIKVPRELNVVIYEHDDFKGDYARVDRNVRCFDRNWNDQVSSLKVEYRDQAVQHRRGDQPTVYGGKDKHSQRPDQRLHFDDSVNSKNVAQVVFDNRVLQHVGNRVWEIQDRRRGATQFDEVNRDDSSVYLKNQYTGERIRVDLFVNDVTVTRSNAPAQRFAITSRRAHAAAFQPVRPNTQPRPQPAVTEPNTRIGKECFNYRAYTDGKSGGLRFLGKEGFHRFQKKPHTGRICHKGVLGMEINKTDFDTNVTVEIEGRKFRFASGEKEDRLHNNWYRKGVKLVVGK